MRTVCQPFYRFTISLFFIVGGFCLPAFLSGCGKCEFSGAAKNERVLYTSVGGRITTLDPVLAADLVSANMIASLYDTLLQYDYICRPYKLIPSMLEKMPEVSDDLLSYKFVLRDDLYFQDDACFAEGKGDSRARRKVTSRDVVFSFLRLADARLHSSGYWLIRGKVKGVEIFQETTSKAAQNDLSPYNKGCEGFEIIDDRTFAIHLQKPDPHLLYGLAMPYMAVVSEKAARYYGNDLSEHSAGSGPFKVLDWMRDYRIILEKNCEFREEYFPEADNPSDRDRPLPFLDRIICYLVKQPLSGWLLFLQGELDMSVLDRDNLEAVMINGNEISPALRERGIWMVKSSEFSINYIGFCFTDPLLSKSLPLRKAISLAYNVETRVKHSNYCLNPAQGPIPPGVSGYDPDFKNPYSKYDVERARQLLVEAGFPEGINPETGQPLELTFDLADTTSFYRQTAELMIDDMKKIGIKIKPVLSNKPRFFQKLREGKVQLFRLSWVGDYPDAENFLQLFYGRNAGSCNRVFYHDPVYDAMYQRIMIMPDSPERTEKYRGMAEYITEQCPWIFESFPVSYRLLHKWLQNYTPHDFAYAQWKYLSVDPQSREQTKKSFKPLEMRELRRR